MKIKINSLIWRKKLCNFSVCVQNTFLSQNLTSTWVRLSPSSLCLLSAWCNARIWPMSAALVNVWDRNIDSKFRTDSYVIKNNKNKSKSLEKKFTSQSEQFKKCTFTTQTSSHFIRRSAPAVPPPPTILCRKTFSCPSTTSLNCWHSLTLHWEKNIKPVRHCEKKLLW